MPDTTTTTTFPSDLSDKIRNVKDKAQQRGAAEKANVAKSDEQIAALQSQRSKDFADSENADKASVLMGYCEGLIPVYDAISADPNYVKQAADLLAVIENVTTAADSLVSAE